MNNVSMTTPQRTYLNSYFEAELSSLSNHSNQSVSSTLPTYGFIKISNTDLSNNDLESDIFSDLYQDDDTDTNSLFKIDNKDIQNIEEIPEYGILKSKVILNKIVDSYKNDSGCYLSKKIFLDPKIYDLSTYINNGSVKINIINEIDTVLSRFLNHKTTDPSFNVVNILTYYKKLMDAFDALDLSEQAYFQTPQDPSNEFSYIERTPSADSNDSNKTSRSKKRDSFTLNKLKGKINYKKRTSTHSRSVSISTVKSQTSIRSSKDVAPLIDYLTAVQSLTRNLNLTYEVFKDSTDEELCNKLNLVIEFLNDYILKFILGDILWLNLKYLQKAALDMV